MESTTTGSNCWIPWEVVQIPSVEIQVASQVLWNSYQLEWRQRQRSATQNQSNELFSLVVLLLVSQHTRIWLIALQNMTMTSGDGIFRIILSSRSQWIFLWKPTWQGKRSRRTLKLDLINSSEGKTIVVMMQTSCSMMGYLILIMLLLPLQTSRPNKAQLDLGLLSTWLIVLLVRVSTHFDFQQSGTSWAIRVTNLPRAEW
jgi:hypothetical protein